MVSTKLVTADELRKHNTPEDCWVLVNGVVWDFTEFAPEHPGGEAIIHNHAGFDASEEYNSIHAPSLVANELGSAKRIGDFDTSSPGAAKVIKPKEPGPSASSASSSKPQRRPLNSILSTHDFALAASENLSAKAWAFFSSAATDCITHDANTKLFGKIWMRPRFLIDSTTIKTQVRMLGTKISFPLFASPTAMCKLSHPDGETVIAKGCANQGIPQAISTNASFPMGDICAAATNGTYIFQLYVNKDRSASEKLLQQAEAEGCKAVIVTIDQPTPPKREADERVKVEGANLAATPNGAQAANDSRGSGLGRTMAGFMDGSLNWDDIRWLRRSTKLPLVLKGVLTPEDAIKAADYGLDGILVSNHGGRSLDTSMPSILALVEMRKTCPEIFDRLEVYLDGGVCRGTDMFKALCLGARAVGMGRAFLYAANYGVEGIEHLIFTMRDEFETTMRMMGCTDVAHLHPGLINTTTLELMLPGAVSLPRAKL